MDSNDPHAPYFGCDMQMISSAWPSVMLHAVDATDAQNRFYL
jgi:hypothetical protein